MRILFLDIDGVLAISKNFFENRHWIKKDDFTKVHSRIKYEAKHKIWLEDEDVVEMPYGWHQKSCKVLKELIEELDLKIVLSSDWKRHYTLEQIGIMFKAYNIPNALIGKTDTVNWGGSLERARMAEIDMWVQEWERANGEKLKWIAVDDLYMTPLGEDHFVLVPDGLSGVGLKDKVIWRFQKQEEKN